MEGFNIKPACKCGAADWEPQGFRYSPGFHSQGYLCRVCGKTATQFENRGGNLFLLTNEAKETDRWLNGPVCNTWANREAEIAALRDANGKRKRAEIVAMLNFDPDKDDRTDERMGAWHNAWDASNKESPFVIPDGLRTAPDLPQAPLSVYGWVYNGERWIKIDPVTSAALPIPAHPFRVRHVRCFARIFSEVSAATGCAIDPIETENQYCSDDLECWFRFRVVNVEFVTGPRKRVIALKWSGDGRIEKALAPLAKRDNVTFADAEIHAWGSDRLIEYITTAILAARVPCSNT